MSTRWLRRALSTGACALAASVAPAAATAQAPVPELLTVRWSGDIRTGYFSMQRLDRDGQRVGNDDLRTRVRFGSTLQLDPTLTARVRLAGRFSTDQRSISFFVRDHAPSVDGLGLGDATLDEAFLNYRPSERWNFRGGRMQTKFSLYDLQAKSLDRGDSPNTDVTWTDGVHVTHHRHGGWNTHLVVQHNARDGASNALRPPLRFGGSASRVTVFAAMESTRAWGPVVQRMLDVTLIPGALDADGPGTGDAGAYLAIVARGALQWPLTSDGGRFSLGGEVGIAPRTPPAAATEAGAADGERAGGLAFQAAATLADVLPRHRFGVGYGHTEAGWLIAPDFRSNDRAVEARYLWAFSSNHSFETRLRWRQELERQTGASNRRQDTDYYVRFNSRF